MLFFYLFFWKHSIWVFCLSVCHNLILWFCTLAKYFNLKLFVNKKNYTNYSEEKGWGSRYIATVLATKLNYEGRRVKKSQFLRNIFFHISQSTSRQNMKMHSKSLTHMSGFSKTFLFDYQHDEGECQKSWLGVAGINKIMWKEHTHSHTYSHFMHAKSDVNFRNIQSKTAADTAAATSFDYMSHNHSFFLSIYSIIFFFSGGNIKNWLNSTKNCKRTPHQSYLFWWWSRGSSSMRANTPRKKSNHNGIPYGTRSISVAKKCGDLQKLFVSGQINQKKKKTNWNTIKRKFWDLAEWFAKMVFSEGSGEFTTEMHF